MLYDKDPTIEPKKNPKGELSLFPLAIGLDGVGVGGAGDGVPALSLNSLSRLLGDLAVGDDLFRL